VRCRLIRLSAELAIFLRQPQLTNLPPRRLSPVIGTPPADINRRHRLAVYVTNFDAIESDRRREKRMHVMQMMRGGIITRWLTQKHALQLRTHKRRRGWRPRPTKETAHHESRIGACNREVTMLNPSKSIGYTPDLSSVFRWPSLGDFPGGPSATANEKLANRWGPKTEAAS
jgi:hypothetical protein